MVLVLMVLVVFMMVFLYLVSAERTAPRLPIVRGGTHLPTLPESPVWYLGVLAPVVLAVVRVGGRLGLGLVPHHVG